MILLRLFPLVLPFSLSRLLTAHRFNAFQSVLCACFGDVFIDAARSNGPARLCRGDARHMMGLMAAHVVQRDSRNSHMQELLMPEIDY